MAFTVLIAPVAPTGCPRCNRCVVGVRFCGIKPNLSTDSQSLGRERKVPPFHFPQPARLSINTSDAKDSINIMLLSVSDLHKSYAGPDGDLPILRGIDMGLARGETLALTGESGSGKSTLLHLVGGLDQPDRGVVQVDGVDIGALDDAGRAAVRRDKIGVVFQQFNLIPSLTVASNIAFQARLADREDKAWITDLADRMGLAEQMGKYPEQLSGGQQQRVAIARTLAAKPALILADEPTGNLDEATADTVMDLMLSLAHETNAALLMVTHSERLAARMGRRMHLRAGQIESTSA